MILERGDAWKNLTKNSFFCKKEVNIPHFIEYNAHTNIVRT